MLRALGSENFGKLAENIETVFRFLGYRFEEAIVRDPVNSKNVVSNDLSEKEKKAIAKATRDALYEENWKKFLW